MFDQHVMTPFSHQGFVQQIPYRPVQVLEVDELLEGHFYVAAQGGYVEVDDNLLANLICPADMQDVPCEMDEPNCHRNCGYLRLCRSLAKYNGNYTCTGAPSEPDGDTGIVKGPAPTETTCPNIHRVDFSCRYIAAHRACKETVHKGHLCPGGHDLPPAREQSLERYTQHIQDARTAGSMANVTHKKVWIKAADSRH